MFCNQCGTELNPDAKYCKKCGLPIASASAPTEIVRDTQPSEPARETRPPEPARETRPPEPVRETKTYEPYQPYQPNQASQSYQTYQTQQPDQSPQWHQPHQPPQPYEAYRPAPAYEQTPAPPQPRAANRRALWIGIAVALVAIIAAGYYYYYSRADVERRLDDAIAKNNLIRPSGESALDYYRKLKESALSEDTRKRYEARLLPLITARPQQMMADLALPNNKPEPTLADWQDAQTLMVWAAEMQPQDNRLVARSSYCAGRVSYLNNRKDDAITFWKRAAEQDTTWALPLNSAGLVYTEQKKYSTARSFFFDAIRREPQFPLPYNNIGTAFLLEKNDAQAEGYYRQAIERAPQWPRPHAWLAEIAMRRKDYNQAVTEFETVLNLDPSGTSGIDLGKIRQQLDQARRLAQEAADPSLAPTPGPIQ